MWHSSAVDGVRRLENIHKAEAKLTVKLGYVRWYMIIRVPLTESLDDWLIILPTLLSIALIGPSYKRKCFAARRIQSTDESQMSRCGMWAYIYGTYHQLNLNRITTTTME